ncbi:cytochrome P450 3A8 [Trichonephila clavipes]|nr:cytochrome P450 3A8 [Trichonephila clavipes]
MPRHRIRAHYEQLSEFERGPIIVLKEAGWTNRRITRFRGRSDAAIRRCWQEWMGNDRFQRQDGSVFSDESRFQLCPDDNRRRVWRRPMQMPILLSLLHITQALNQELRSRQDNAKSHTELVAMNCLTACQTLPWLARSPYLFPIKNVWDMMEKRLHRPGNVDDLVQQLEQIWLEIPQETVKVLYHSVPSRLAFYIKARGGAFGAFTMDVIASSAFGTKIDSHNDPENEFVKNVRNSFANFTFARMIFAMFIPAWMLRWIPLDLNPMILDKRNFFRDITMNVIKQRKETGKRYNDFLQMLMDIADETSENENQEAAEDEADRFGSVSHNGVTSFTSKNKKLTNTELLSQCVLFFMVGYETSASVLTFVAYCLATNPEWQEKLIKEVDEAFQKYSEMSYDVVREMKVLDAIVSETLRMHPPIGSGERTAVEEYKLGDTGIVMEKGMRIVFLFYAMHYDPEFFPDPETFNPERFMEGYEPKHPQYAYLPFGAGPRNCLGMRFALLEIKMCIANLLRHYRLKPHTTTKVPLEYKKGAIFLTVNELSLTVEKRTDLELKS